MTQFKKIRVAAGLSQSQAAKLLGKGLSSVQMWDRGDRECSNLILVAFKALTSPANKHDT